MSAATRSALISGTSTGPRAKAGPGGELHNFGDSCLTQAVVGAVVGSQKWDIRVYDPHECDALGVEALIGSEVARLHPIHAEGDPRQRPEVAKELIAALACLKVWLGPNIGGPDGIRPSREHRRIPMTRRPNPRP